MDERKQIVHQLNEIDKKLSQLKAEQESLLIERQKLLQQDEQLLSNNFNQYKIKKEEERYITALSQLNSEYELLLSNQKELESKLNENLTSDFAPLIIEKVKIIRNVLNNYTLKLLQSTNFEIDIFKQNLSMQIQEKRFEEENKVIEIRKSKTNLMKLEQLLVENLTNDYSQPIIENIQKINKLNYDT